MTGNFGISFIIPALNEERNISETINSIKKAMQGSDHEIIVADNGSQDRTVEISENLGAKVVINESATIAGLRNFGVSVSIQKLLVFIDADVQLSNDWHDCLVDEISKYPQDGLFITGRTCLVPENGKFIHKHWFSKLLKTPTNYINSGHLITTRKMFEKINGFDATLRTAEDYDFCQRAKAKGGQIFESKKLRAYHFGYPETLTYFFIREAWHGSEDFSNINKLFRSKTAIASLLNSFLIISGLTVILLEPNLYIGILLLLVSFSFCSFLTWFKFGPDSIINFLKTACCFEIYLLARTSSAFLKFERPVNRQ